jgi:glucose/arabinose dehydrogenase
VGAFERIGKHWATYREQLIASSKRSSACCPVHERWIRLFRKPTRRAVQNSGVAGFSDTQVNNPYGMAIGPDGGLYFCDRGNQRIRRVDLNTKKISRLATIQEGRATRKKKH